MFINVVTIFLLSFLLLFYLYSFGIYLLKAIFMIYKNIYKNITFKN